MENLLDGTWADTEPPPDEWNDFQLMKAMQWSWREFCETPDYVKRYCRDILIRTNAAQAKATRSGEDDVQMAGHRRIRTRRR